MPETSASLLIRLREARDQESWEQFFEQYWRLIYSFVRRCGLPPSDAEDVLQTVVTEVFQAMPRFEYDRTKGTFRAYLRTITQRKVTDHLRRQACRATVPLEQRSGGDDLAPLADPAGAEANQAWEQDWQRNVLQLCLDRVSREVEAKTFQAFQLYAIEGWSVKETAAFLKMSPAGVYQAKSRVARRVRESYRRERDED